MAKVARPALLALAALLSLPAFAEGLTRPPSGDNQRSTVTQQIGPVTASVEYSSPRVNRPGKEERRGKIWGKLVPYGMTDLGFNGCTSCPWRAGANENTVFTVSQDVKIQGQPLPAGRYGLHMIPGPEEFTVIFSKNSSSWGSYWYDPKEDALRVTTKPVKSDFHDFLDYEFVEREPARATVALKWEELAIPFTITVENAPQLYVEAMHRDLRDDRGFNPRNWQLAADYCLTNKVNLPEALKWAEKAAFEPGLGEENFNTLMTVSRAQAANGKDAEAAKTAERALAHPTTNPLDIHLYGRKLLTEGKKADALRIFQFNAKRFPDQWPVHVGLMRGYAANGETKKALDEAKLAVKQAPDEANRKNLEGVIKALEEGKRID
jgi:Protein of unknown function (DUF2911)